MERIRKFNALTTINMHVGQLHSRTINRSRVRGTHISKEIEVVEEIIRISEEFEIRIKKANRSKRYIILGMDKLYFIVANADMQCLQKIITL